MVNIIAFISLGFVLLASCSPITIEKSARRDIPLGGIALSNGVTLETTGAVNMDVILLVNHADFFPSGFKIKASNLVVYVDPLLVDNPEPADAIFITHAHADHFSLPDIKALANSNTAIVCPKTVAPELAGYKTILVAPGDKGDFPGLEYEATSSYNKGDSFVPHPIGDNNTGFVLSIAGNRLYFAGDTDWIPEMGFLSNITVAAVPIGGDKLTMGIPEAVKAVQTISPKIAVPTHYSINGTNYAQAFADMVLKTSVKPAEVRILQIKQ